MRLTLLIIIVLFASCVSKKNVATQTHVIPSEIYGDWVVTELNIFPFEHLDDCGKLNLGTIFQFTDKRQLKVFNSEMTQLCNYPQSFSVTNNKVLGVMVYDVGIMYTIEKLSDENLTLRTTRVPTFFPQKRKKYSEGFEKDSIAVRIETEGIIIKLEKRN
ncbi:hypothetical protein [uncultured Maribacter sp.]|uniref:hypothetical protein n=1 Tax=uncultured Maribacter sp. TaxID=431308 RepID=UPI00262F2CEF|nr:hypothetical protein [uncultured Maribacter sp.]